MPPGRTWLIPVRRAVTLRKHEVDAAARVAAPPDCSDTPHFAAS